MPTGGLSVVLRRERTRNGICRLAASVEDWLSGWKNDGPQTSQIARCGLILRGLVIGLGARAADLPTDERAFVTCRALDGDVAVVERLWRLLADRFGQRRDATRAPILRAADELIWSCVQQTVLLADQLPPLPLAYLEPAFTASATPRIKPPSGLPVSDRKLADALRVLPVPLIGLPIAIDDEPWWLVLVAHEVGHHIQYDLDAQAVARSGTTLAHATGDPVWQEWRFELFADAFSVLALGPAAITAIAELEWGDGPAMMESRPLYPPVMVRLAFMAAIARERGYGGPLPDVDSWASTLAAANTAESAVVAGLLRTTTAAARALLAMPLGSGTFGDMLEPASPRPAGVPPDPDELAMQRRLDGQNMNVSRGRAAPRRAAALALDAYQQIAQVNPITARDQARRDLRARTLELIRDVADDSVAKRATTARAPVQATVDSIFAALREAEQEATH